MAAWRSATWRPTDHEWAVVETPFGLIPMNLIVQLARGPDVLAAAILARILMGR